MMNMRVPHTLVFVFASYALGCGAGDQRAADGSDQDPTAEQDASASIMPLGVANPANPTQDDWNDLAWLSFIALNWPADGVTRGSPDQSRSLGASGPDGAPDSEPGAS